MKIVVYNPFKLWYNRSIKWKRKGNFMQISITYKNQFGGTPFSAANVNCPQSDIEEALEYAYRWTQNIMGSWSNKIGQDANDNVEVLHFNNDGSGLRSSMVGDEFYIAETKQTFVCDSFGFKEIK